MTAGAELTDEQAEILRTIREFVDRDALIVKELSRGLDLALRVDTARHDPYAWGLG
jgi:hypothetical protein